MTGSIRLDKWLWQARFFHSRALAARICNAGLVRVDGLTVDKAHHAIRPGHVLTFPQARHVRVVRVVALGTCRGPAKEAALLYEDLSDAAPVPRIATIGPLPKPWAWSK
jgi:ribosome-associated heat shock protein Hsp15